MRFVEADDARLLQQVGIGMTLPPDPASARSIPSAPLTELEAVG